MSDVRRCNSFLPPLLLLLFLRKNYEGSDCTMATLQWPSIYGAVMQCQLQKC
jgi:hypothetical protein